MAKEQARTARAELEAWYLQSLLPKLARAGGRGAVDPAAIEALDADMRALLDLLRTRGQAT